MKTLTHNQNGSKYMMRMLFFINHFVLCTFSFVLCRKVLGIVISLILCLPLVSGTVQAGDGEIDTVRRGYFDKRIINKGTPGDDTQIDLGTPGKDFIRQIGYGGNDTQYISGSDGNDWLEQDGGIGKDNQTILGGTGDDYQYQTGGAGE